MSRYIITIILGLAIVAGPAAASSRPPQERPLVFVLAGQSNMAGRALPVPVERPSRNVLTLNAQGRLVPAVDPLGDEGQGRAAGPGAGVGPGITFGRDVAAHGHRVILVQCALGGSSASQWLPGAPLFNACLARARQARRYGPVEGIVDIQGETDAEDSTDAQLWATRFEAFLAGAWAQLGRVPVVFGQIGNVTPTPFAYRSAVQAGQADVHLGRCVHMVKTSDLALGPDVVHFTAPSAVTIGHRMAAAWRTMSGCGPRR